MSHLYLCQRACSDLRTSGGTNLRVAFIELFGGDLDDELQGAGEQKGTNTPRLVRHLEHSWPIQEHLKNKKSESLFGWIGGHVTEVVRQGSAAFDLHASNELPMGVTFSFPMTQNSLSEAIVMPMGKGFVIPSDLDLGGNLLRGYDEHRTPDIPPIKIAAICNDSVATLVSFIYQFPAQAHQKAAMGLIVGTGCNATIPLKLSSLHASKRPASISVLPDQDANDVRIAVNTEWTINGSVGPLHAFGLISHWDTELDQAGEAPGFQPLEYMTAGRYLGELARLVLIDYIAAVEGMPTKKLPSRLRQRFGLTTTFISHFYPESPKGPLLEQLQREFPSDNGSVDLLWTEPLADVLYHISRAIEVRAAGIVAAATVGLLRTAGELPASSEVPDSRELVVGYTGGCIQHFQNYLADTQAFIDAILAHEFDGRDIVKVTLSPCHDGGITGAGILVPAALASRSA